jgi:hypothetical protein
MAANTISQLTTANTFQHWLTATQSLIGTANLLTNGAGSTFYANTRLEVGGANATLNVVTSATINDMIGNTANVITIQARNLNITENVTSNLNTTGQAFIGSNLTVYGNTTISGDLTVSGNITLDTIGFDDLTVSGSGTFANTLSVTGNSTFSNANVTSVLTANIARITTANITVANITTANIGTLVGTANSAIFTAITNAEGTALAFSIALG